MSASTGYYDTGAVQRQAEKMTTVDRASKTRLTELERTPAPTYPPGDIKRAHHPHEGMILLADRSARGGNGAPRRVYAALNGMGPNGAGPQEVLNSLEVVGVAATDLGVSGQTALAAQTGGIIEIVNTGEHRIVEGDFVHIYPPSPTSGPNFGAAYVPVTEPRRAGSTLSTFTLRAALTRDPSRSKNIKLQYPTLATQGQAHLKQAILAAAIALVEAQAAGQGAVLKAAVDANFALLDTAYDTLTDAKSIPLSFDGDLTALSSGFVDNVAAVSTIAKNDAASSCIGRATSSAGPGGRFGIDLRNV